MTIVFSEIDSTTPVPGRYIELDILSGATGRATGERRVYIMGSRVAAGTSSDNDVKSVNFNSWSDAQAWYGAGSEGAYQAAIAFLTTGGDRVPIYGVALPDAGGTKAQGTFTFANAATGTGSVKVRIGGLTITTTIASGDSITTIGDNLVADFNAVLAILKPPVTLTNAVGVVTVEANNSGAHFNTFPIEVIEITPGITTTCTADASTLGTAQAGVGDVTLTTALGKLTAIPTHYIAFSDYIQGDATKGLTALKNHMVTKGDGNNKLGGRVVAGSTDTLSNAVTLVAAVDSSDAERMILGWEEEGKSWEAAMSASLAIQLASQTDATRPVNGLLHNMLVAQDPTKRPGKTSLKTALQGGITPMYAPDDTNVETCRCVVMRMDVMVPLDNATMETLDELRNRIDAKWAVRFVRFKIKETAEECYTAYCTTPDGVLAVAIEVCREMEEEDKLQGVDDHVEAADAEYVSGGGCAVSLPAEFVPGLHKIMGKIIMQVPG